MTYRASIIIRCYNEEKHIGRLLNGIMHQTVKNLEIIVVDSGSTDATKAIASRYPVKIISIRPEEFSFGRSLNLGCEAANAKFIVIASAHAYPVYEDWLEKLITPLADPQVALVYGKQRGNEITKYSEHQVFVQWFPEKENRNQKQPFCNNANAAIRRELWKQVPYNENLTGLEDIDWANRVISMGYHLIYMPLAEVIHVHTETPHQIYNRYRREAIAFKQIFPQENLNFWECLRLWADNVFSDYRHSLRDGVLWREIISIPCFRLMQFRGTYRGYRQHLPVSQQLRRTFYYPNRKRCASMVTEDKRTDLRIRYSALDE